MTYQLKERILSNSFLWKLFVREPIGNIDMHKNEITCFAVIYIPFYALQCARQKCVFEKRALKQKSLEQLSWNVWEGETFRVEEQGTGDEASSDFPIALLDLDGIHVIELNQVAEDAGIQSGMSTSQALARASDLVLYKRSPANEQHLQDTLLQLVYHYSPFIENSAPGIYTLDLRGKRIR